METNSIKQKVIESYGYLARTTKKGMPSKLFDCCNTSSSTHKIGAAIGYSDQELQAVPEGANLGVGCGNPSNLVEINNGDVVIDLGAGAGFDAFIVSPLVGEEGKVIGVDLSDDMLELARRNTQKNGYENVSFVKGDIESLPITDGLADIVISNCVINLSLRKREVYKEAYRVLKKGGRMAISDIVLEKELPEISHLSAHVACVAGAEPMNDYIRYVQEAGFRAIKIERKADFPLELMLTDPQLQKAAREMNLSMESEQARKLASCVKSISLTAIK